MGKIIQEISDRAFSDVGSAIMIKDLVDGLYSLFLPVTNIPATGSAPETVEKTVTTEGTKSYIMGRQDSPQKELTFYAHRDNFIRLKNAKGQTREFLQVNPDGTGFLFRGQISFYQDEVSVGSNITGKAVITVTGSTEEPVDNVMDLIKPTALFNGEIADTVVLKGTEKKEMQIVADPEGATVTAESDTTGVATATYTEGKLTVTGVKKGSSIVTLKVTQTGYADNFTTILVIVEE